MAAVEIDPLRAVRHDSRAVTRASDVGLTTGAGHHNSRDSALDPTDLRASARPAAKGVSRIGRVVPADRSAVSPSGGPLEA